VEVGLGATVVSYKFFGDSHMKSWENYFKIKGDGWSSEWDSVDSLLKHLARKSQSECSRKAYCWVLYKFCKECRKNPDELLKMEKGWIEKSIQAFADRANVRGSATHANNLLALLETFFRVNGFAENQKLRLKSFYVPPRSQSRREYVPTLEEALKMANCAGSLRDRAITLTLISTGLRNSTLRAVKYGEGDPNPLLREYTINNELKKDVENIIVTVYDEMKQTVPAACKNRIPYYIFTCRMATEAIKDYLRERQGKYGVIGDEEPLFISEYNQIPRHKRRYVPISAEQVQIIIKNAAKRAGIKQWKYVTPTSLRKTFRNTLKNQPSEVRLDQQDQEFFMGHTLPGSQEAYYDMSKIEEMRLKYSKFIFEPSSMVMKKERTVQKVVPEEELPTFLAQGWHLDASLASGNVVVSKCLGIKFADEVTKEEGEQMDTRHHGYSMSTPPKRDNGTGNEVRQDSLGTYLEPVEKKDFSNVDQKKDSETDSSTQFAIRNDQIRRRKLREGQSKLEHFL